MTTKNIEEIIGKIVEKEAKRLCFQDQTARIFWDGFGGEDKKREYVEKAKKSEFYQVWTEIYQAGIDEAVEKIRPFVERVRLDVDVIVCDCGEEYKESDLDLSVGELEQALDDTLKALKDNK